MKFRKRLNNNVIVAIDDKGAELVLFGRGLGFDPTASADVDMTRVERTYVLKEHSASRKLQQLLEMISIDYVDVAMLIFGDAQASLSVPLSDSVIVPLADHVHMAVTRRREGIEIKNMMLQEIQRFYRDEYAVGSRAVALVNERFATTLTDDEAGFIALHLVNAELGAREGARSLAKITDFIHEVELMVRMHYASEIDVNSDQYRRFITHLKFFAERLAGGRVYASGDVSKMLATVRETHPRAGECVVRIAEFLATKYDHALTDDENLYLTLHIAHITSQHRH